MIMMDQKTNGKVKSKKPFLSLLARRSTRVEPQTFDENSSNENQSFDQTLSLNNVSNTDHNSTTTNNHNQLDLPSTSKTLPKSAIFTVQHRDKLLNNNNSCSNSNRLSLCCSLDDKNNSPSPPINPRFSQPTSKKDMIYLRDTLNLDLNKTFVVDSKSDGNKQLETKTDKAVEEVGEKKAAMEQRCSQIPVSACRSRFRQRFMLPPGHSTDSLLIKEMTNNKSNLNFNASSPDIAQNTISFVENRDARKSLSYEQMMVYGETSVNRPASTDSLARQALMAAHVLHLIPAEKARQRNFLHGRLGTISLLGASELDKILPSRDVTIFMGTWNMNGQTPPKQMNAFVLPEGIENVPDIIAFGTQESCSERFEWEVNLQETLGPSHILLHSAVLGTLHLAIFIRRDLIWFCSMPEDGSFSVRPGTAFKTKGAVAISFSLFGTSMLFVTSHLTAHQQKVKERVQDVKRIIHALDLPRNLILKNRNKDVTQNFDCVYWCGDLNFRLSEPRANLLKWIETTQFPLPAHLPHGYLHTDQLSSVLSDGAAFKGFREARITFPPTYKYDPGTQQFDTSSKQRAPAYTDRILFKYKPPTMGFRRGSAGVGGVHTVPTIECLAYDSAQSIVSSDHKPVWALFRNAIRPGLDSIPLAAGLFNREVYLEGMRRRLDSTDGSASAVCVIQ